MDIGLQVLLSDRRLCMRARKNRDTWSATVEALAPVPDRGTPASVNPSAVDIPAHVIFVSIFGAACETRDVQNSAGLPRGERVSRMVRTGCAAWAICFIASCDCQSMQYLTTRSTSGLSNVPSCTNIAHEYSLSPTRTAESRSADLKGCVHPGDEQAHLLLRQPIGKSELIP